ncbi:MAG TPA: rRNA maturation RNase YbeY [Thermoanaerobaculia bacterium]|nr:rRNA maturation RNase YbeY [Thermoanaerobaculia bacterium]
MRVSVDVQSRVSGAPPARRVRALLARVVRIVLGSKVQGPRSKVEISVLFCGDRRMRSLNRRFRDNDRSTDVLAFPAGPPKPPPSPRVRRGGRRRRTAGGDLLGDIVISVPYAAREARRHGTPAARELDRLLVHGFLHLCGYDHETDSGEMDALEARLRQRLGLAQAA